jgi:ATP-dependent Lhr-like helicase
MTEAQIKAALPRTWIPFFSRFGRLTRVQIQTVPLVLAGGNTVVISPSASGKTEAVVAPVVERLGETARSGLKVLYVSPTRALVNDLFRRLVEPLAYTGLSIARKTGDRPAISESRLPSVLITTPESLDSLLCRHPRVFRDLAVVILDELHLLDNAPRGDQLRMLLERLRRIRRGLTFHALSATIEDAQIGERYFPNARIVRVGERRAIDHELLRYEPGFVPRLYRMLSSHGLDKVLCFFNARSFVEMYSRVLDRPPFQGRVWVHHASLTRQQRETTERLMMTEKRGVLCATSTLELGIDIGDIDAVVLFRPPFSVSSLLQRIGRGNRRSGNLKAVGIYANEWERMLFEAMFESARAGRLFEKPYEASLSVLPQQILSYLFQRRRIGTTLESLRRVTEAAFPEPGLVREVLAELREQGLVVAERPGLYHVSSELERETSRGKIHSNIQEKSFGDFEVVEIESGRTIGRVFYLFERFVLAGKTWEVVERREAEKRVLVRCRGSRDASAKVFEGTGTGGYPYRFAGFLKQRLFPEMAECEYPLFRHAGRVYLLHLLGELYGGLVAAGLQVSGQELLDCAGRAFIGPEATFKSGRQWRFPVPRRQDLRKVISGQLTQLEDRLGSGAFFRLLPERLQVEDHCRALDAEGLLGYLSSLKPVEVEPTPELVALAGIQPGGA